MGSIKTTLLVGSMKHMPESAKTPNELKPSLEKATERNRVKNALSNVKTIAFSSY